MSRNRRLLLPLVLIAIGLVVLLANLGVLSSEALQRLGDLWPLLLVIVGLQLVLNHTMPRQRATLVGLAATAVIIIAAVAYSTLAPASRFGTQTADASQRLSGLNAATLSLNYSAASLEVNRSTASDLLYRAHVDYPAGENPPVISVDQQTGTIEIRDSSSFSPFHLFGSNRRRLVVSLTDLIPWTIEIGGGASNVHLNLAHVPLANLEISGGASSIDAQLATAKGTVAIHVSGGASNVSLRIPPASEWNVDVSGGVSGLTIDGQSSGGLGDFHKQSNGYDAATNRFNIELSGGVSHLDLRTG
jgi:hypothetical protein